MSKYVYPPCYLWGSDRSEDAACRKALSSGEVGALRLMLGGGPSAPRSNCWGLGSPRTRGGVAKGRVEGWGGPSVCVGGG